MTHVTCAFSPVIKQDHWKATLFSEDNLESDWWQKPTSKCHLARGIHSLSYHLRHISRYTEKRRHPVPQERWQRQAIRARRNHSTLLPCSLSASKTPSETTCETISQHPFLLRDLSRWTYLEICFVTSLPRKHHVVAQCLKMCNTKSHPLTILLPAFHLQVCTLSATY